MDISCKFQAVIFQEEAVFHGSLQDGTLGLMDRVKQALEWLRKIETTVILVTQQDPENIQKNLENFALTELFTYADQLQIIQTHQHENEAVRALPHQPPVYYRPLIDKNITLNQCLAVVATAEGLRAAQDTGISNIIGFFGSPDIPFGEAQNHIDGFRRASETRTRTTLIPIGLYSLLPNTIWGMKASR